ncbi:MAG: hypothetical protein WD689_00300 [Gaiellaceae bacterium]
MGEVIRRDELHSALEARRELGPDYDDQVVDALVEKIERRLSERRPPARRSEPYHLGVPLGSLGIAIPLIGAAGGTAGFAGVLVACLAIVLVNLAYAFRR